MNIKTIDYIRANKLTEIEKDIPFINWLIKLDNYHLESIKDDIIKDVKTEITKKQGQTIRFINYLINERKN